MRLTHCQATLSDYELHHDYSTVRRCGDFTSRVFARYYAASDGAASAGAFGGASGSRADFSLFGVALDMGLAEAAGD